jgi:hypothetical protein
MATLIEFICWGVLLGGTLLAIPVCWWIFPYTISFLFGLRKSPWELFKERLSFCVFGTVGTAIVIGVSGSMYLEANNPDLYKAMGRRFHSLDAAGTQSK